MEDRIGAPLAVGEGTQQACGSEEHGGQNPGEDQYLEVVTNRRKT